MLKRLAIPAVAVLLVAAIAVAVYYQQRHAVGEGYDIKCTQPSVPASAPAELACKVQPSQDAEQGHPGRYWWNVILAWPEGITAWLLLLTLGGIVWQAWETREAAQSAEKQITLQSAALRQWVNVVPLGINIPRTLENPCEIMVQFEVLNKTDYLVTIKGVEFELAPNIHSIGKFKIDCDFALVPRKSDDDSAFPFAGKCVVDISELDGWGKIFIVAGDIKFLDCMEREQVQHFQDLYRGFIDGRLERMKPLSITTTEDESESQNPN
ncbi:MAG: hypothetical protein WBE76_00620 [Terracidiphilus sp.]